MGKKRNRAVSVYVVGWVIGGLAAYPYPIFAHDTGGVVAAPMLPQVEMPAIPSAQISAMPSAPIPPMPSAPIPMIPSTQIPGVIPSNASGGFSAGIPIIENAAIPSPASSGSIPSLNNPAASVPVANFLHPSGHTIVEGDVSIGINPLNPQQQIIQQNSPQAIVDWVNFSIGSGARTTVKQPNSDSVILNRVTGGFPSNIWGTLEANGKIFLINPAGVTIWQGGKVDIPSGFHATTANINNQDFLAGRYHFKQEAGQPYAIVNHGEITVGEGGLLSLVAPGVANHGVIRARLSRVILAEGSEYILVDPHGDGLIQFATSQPAITEQVKTSDGKTFRHAVSHTGTIEAEGSKVVLLSTGAVKNILGEVINTSGVIRATSASKDKSGAIILYDAGSAARGEDDKGIVKVAGSIDATGKREGEYGGTVVITGKRVQGGNQTEFLRSSARSRVRGGKKFSGNTSEVLGSADPGTLGEAEKITIDVSGYAGPGTILFGGDAHKENKPQQEAYHQNLEKTSAMTRGSKVHWPDFFIDRKDNNEVPAAEATIQGRDIDFIANNLHKGAGGKLVITSAMSRIPGSKMLNKSKGFTRILGGQYAKGGSHRDDPTRGSENHGGYIQLCGDRIENRGRSRPNPGPGGKPGLFYVDPFDMTIEDNPASNGFWAPGFPPPPPAPGGTSTWVPTGPDGVIDAVEVETIINGGVNIVFSTSGAGGQAGNFNVNAALGPLNFNPPIPVSMTIAADNSINFAAVSGIDDTSPNNFTLILSTPGTVTASGQFTIAGLSINVGTSFAMGNPPGPPPLSSISGDTTGSNISIQNQPLPTGLYFFNGVDLANYNPVTTTQTPSAATINTIVSALAPGANNANGGEPTNSSPLSISTNNAPMAASALVDIPTAPAKPAAPAKAEGGAADGAKEGAAAASADSGAAGGAEAGASAAGAGEGGAAGAAGTGETAGAGSAAGSEGAAGATAAAGAEGAAGADSGAAGGGTEGGGGTDAGGDAGGDAAVGPDAGGEGGEGAADLGAGPAGGMDGGDGSGAAGSSAVQSSVPTSEAIGGSDAGRERAETALAAAGREGVAEGAFNNSEAMPNAVIASATAATSNCGEEQLCKDLEEATGRMSREDIAKALGEDKNAPIGPEGIAGINPNPYGDSSLNKEKLTNAESAAGDEVLLAKRTRDWSIEELNFAPEYLETVGPQRPKHKMTLTEVIRKFIESLKNKIEGSKESNKKVIPKNDEKVMVKPKENQQRAENS